MNVEILITLVLGVGFAFSIGAGDETLATLVGSGAMRLRRAVILGGVLAALGAMLFSSGVAQSIGTEMLNASVLDMSRYQAWIMVSILISVTVWILIASRIGMPVSTTYSIIGAFIGVALCGPLIGTDFSSALHWNQMQEIVLGWIFSPLLGLGSCLGISFLMNRFIRRRISGLAGLERIERVFMIILIFFSCFNELNRSGNDAGKALGIFYGLAGSGQIDPGMLVAMIVIGGIAVGLGLIIIGKYLLRNVGKHLIEIRPSDALCIEISMAIVLLMANLLALPISGGQVLIFAIVGMSLIKHETVNKRRLKRIVYSWIITFPVAALTSAAVLSLLLVVFRI
nr:inorganic phosphate transporter [Candidatus Sigynarchaeota archaeon]